MNYLTDLTKEELKYICTEIPYQETVYYFRRYPKEFAKLRPGFRVKTLNEDMISRTLYEFRNRDFIATYLVNKIDRWIMEITEELKKAKELGMDTESSYINVLSASFFSDNVELFFKIRGEEKSKDYLQVLSSAVAYEASNRKKDEKEKDSTEKKMIEITKSQEKLKQEVIDGQKRLEKLKKSENELNTKLKETLGVLNEEQERYRKSIEKNEKLKIELKKVRDDEIWKTSEMQQKIDGLSVRISEQEEQVSDYQANILELKSNISSAEEEIQTWKNQVRTREKQLFTYKAERATLLTAKDADKKQIRELKAALEQALNAEKTCKKQFALFRAENNEHIEESNATPVSVTQKKYSDSEQYMPLYPENMDDFIECFSYNLENIGFNQNEDGALDFLNYIERVLFQGIPILIKRGPGINIANSLANTLYGVPIAARILYTRDSSIQKVENFLEKTADRVVCLDGFIGNCNVMELIPVLEQHRNKIIILTYMFERTLTFVPNEILSYVYFINVDVFSGILRIKDVTEETSEIKEKSYAYKGFTRTNTRLKKIFQEIACECGIESSTALIMADMIEDENQLNEMLMFTLLPYISKVLGKNPYNCSKRLQRYAGESGRSLKKDIIMRWFGL